MMKIPKSLFITISLIILTLFTVFPAKSEAATYDSIIVTAVNDFNVTISGIPTHYVAGLDGFLAAGNSIGILSFGDGIASGVSAIGATITGTLTVGTGTNITLGPTA